MLGYGHKPVFVKLNNRDFNTMRRGKATVCNQKWERIPAECKWRKGPHGLVVAFEFTLNPDFTHEDHIVFAYAHPFTFTDIQKSTDDFEAAMERLA